MNHRRVSELLEHAPAVAWARPHGEPVIVLTAEAYAELTGRTVPAGTFAPSRFCPNCARFRGPRRRCPECEPPTCSAPRCKGATSGAASSQRRRARRRGP